MAQLGEDVENLAKSPASPRYFGGRGRGWRWTAIFGLIILLAAIAAWIQRETIVNNIVEGQLAELGIDAEYDIISIGPRNQIIRNLKLGNGDQPDLWIEEIRIKLAYGFGAPEIDQLTLIKPQLRASYSQDRGFSLGEVDRLFTASDDGEAQLPDIDLTIDGGEVMIHSPYGLGHGRFSGKGRLTGGFKGAFGLQIPQLAGTPCNLQDFDFHGEVTTRKGQAYVAGPARMAALACGGPGRALSGAVLHLRLVGDRDLAGLTATANLELDDARLAGANLARAKGDLALDYRDGILVTKFDLSAREVKAAQFASASFKMQGELRADSGDDRMEVRGGLEAGDIRLARAIFTALDPGQSAIEGTLAQPLLRKFRAALARETLQSRLDAQYLLRFNGDNSSIIIPQLMWRAPSGQNLLAVSQLKFALSEGGISNLSANISAGGGGLPRLAGRMESGDGDNPQLQLRLAPYRAGDAVISAPQLAISQSQAGNFDLQGRLELTGAIGGGRVEALNLPISGRVGPAAGRGGMQVTLWHQCMQAKFAALELGGVDLRNQSIRFCPDNQRPILSSNQGNFHFDVHLPRQEWSGIFAGEDARISLNSAHISDLNGIDLRGFRLVSGAGDTQTILSLKQVEGSFAGGIAGRFRGDEAQLGPVPLKILDLQGDWRLDHGQLIVENAQFDLEDRAAPKRFNPMSGRNAMLIMADGVIDASAQISNRQTQREIARVEIEHELASGAGHADLVIDRLQFDDGLQPEQISDLALGVVALADGMVSGKGRIEWRDGQVTSHGEVTTQDFDFAAAFGPVAGLKGTIKFIDLISLTTAPDQRLQISSINPGIEVFNGEILFEVRGGEVIALKQGEWPFLGGSLTLRPVDLNFTRAEERRYIIEIVGADAAQFIATMELSNLAATGTFDGTLPIIFDQFGNGRIENGLLISRPPGGNLSYVGDLTYEDLSAIGNFAFGALRSLDYSQMMVEMNGPLTGEIVTRLRFDGVRQGAGSSQNFITRQIAKLPIQFRVNVRAPFYQLLTSFQSIYDPSFLRDPRDLGLLESDGTRFIPPDVNLNNNFAEPPIQRQESEQMP